MTTPCPRCQAAMQTVTLEGHLGRPIEVDLCEACQAFWFDAQESLRLSPGSTLKLFERIGDLSASVRPQPEGPLACPRCRNRLRQTRDMQRTTRFEYYRCPGGHGRFTTFFNFLREKDFIRPLSAAQLAELRRSVQSVHCSNCGAPVDLSVGSACAHCGAPLSMLDLGQARKLVDQLRGADQRSRTVDPALPLSLERARRETTAAFDAFERDQHWMQDVSAAGLVGAGLQAVTRWLKRQA